MGASDIDVWRQQFAFDHFGDANGDGATFGDDFLIWQQQFGAVATLPGGADRRATAVPETRLGRRGRARNGPSFTGRRRRLSQQAENPAFFTRKGLHAPVGSAMIMAVESQEYRNWVDCHNSQSRSAPRRRGKRPHVQVV